MCSSIAGRLTSPSDLVNSSLKIMHSKHSDLRASVTDEAIQQRAHSLLNEIQHESPTAEELATHLFRELNMSEHISDSDITSRVKAQARILRSDSNSSAVSMKKEDLRVHDPSVIPYPEISAAGRYGLWCDPESQLVGCALRFSSFEDYAKQRREASESIDIIVGRGNFYKGSKMTESMYKRMENMGKVGQVEKEESKDTSISIPRVGDLLETPYFSGRQKGDLDTPDLQERGKRAFTIDFEVGVAPDLCCSINCPDGLGAIVPDGSVDTIYLERLAPNDVLLDPYTYSNCFRMLKKGGELIVDLNHLKPTQLTPEEKDLYIKAGVGFQGPEELLQSLRVIEEAGFKRDKPFIQYKNPFNELTAQTIRLRKGPIASAGDSAT